MRRGPQLMQPTPNRAAQRVLLDPLDRRRLSQCFDQHRGGVLAIPPDRAGAPRGQRDGLRILDLDKDVIRPGPCAVDRGDQPLTALVGAQVANRAVPLIGTPLVEAPGKAAADVASRRS